MKLSILLVTALSAGVGVFSGAAGAGDLPDGVVRNVLKAAAPGVVGLAANAAEPSGVLPGPGETGGASRDTAGGSRAVRRVSSNGPELMLSDPHRPSRKINLSGSWFDTTVRPLPGDRPGGRLSLLSGAFPRGKTSLGGGTIVVGDDPPDEELVINGSFDFEGDIIVINQGHLLFDDADARLRGRFVVMDDGRVDILGGSFTFLSSFLYQYATALVGRGRLSVRHARLDYLGGIHGIFTAEQAGLIMADVESNGSVTVSLVDEGRVTLSDVDQAGEYVVMGRNEVEMRDTTGIILWLTFGEGEVADISFPDGDVVPWFRYPVPPWHVTDPGWRVKLQDCSSVLFTVMTKAGCDLTLRDGMVRAVGIIIENGAYAIDGLVNGINRESYEMDLSDRRIALRNAGVETWNVYPLIDSTGSTTHSILGEELTGSGEHSITDSIFDGTGGYLSSGDGGTAILIQCGIFSPITIRESGVLVMGWCGTPSGEIRIDSGGIFVAVGTPLLVRPKVTDLGISAVGWLEAPVDPVAGDPVTLRGTVVVDSGVDWPDDLSSYTLEYANPDDPDTWYPIAVGFSEVWCGPLTTWDTTGLAAGIYLVRLTFEDNLGNVVETIEAIELE